MKTALIFDTETTGLIENRAIKIDKQPEIIEIYAETVDFETGNWWELIDVLIKPKNKIPDNIIKITNITNQMVQPEPDFSFFAFKIRDMIERAECIIGHNVAFDVEMLDIEFERLGTRPPKFPPQLCTLEQTMHLNGYRLKLSELYEQLFGETFNDAHRAKPDVKALTRCCLELYKKGILG